MINVTSKESALNILLSNDIATETLIAEAKILREKYFGRRIIIQVLTNAKSGRCSEDCSFCSQSAHYDSNIKEYPLKSAEEICKEAEAAYKINAERFCIVTATREAFPELVENLCPAIRKIKSSFPKLKICLSLGILSEAAAKKLKEFGGDRYNHNLETSERYFPNLVRTHKWQDRYSTLLTARRFGFELCSGGIIGVGETDEDIIDMLFSLKELHVESVPINMFNPRIGTPLANVKLIDSEKALRVLALARLIMPETDIRLAGGREIILAGRQKEALYCVTSIFSNGYLTTEGQGYEADVKMIEEIGYEYRIERE